MVLLSYFLTFIDSLIYVRHFIISIISIPEAIWDRHGRPVIPIVPDERETGCLR